MNCIRKPPNASIGTVCEYAHNGITGIASSAATDDRLPPPDPFRPRPERDPA